MNKVEDEENKVIEKDAWTITNKGIRKEECWRREKKYESWRRGTKQKVIEEDSNKIVEDEAKEVSEEENKKKVEANMKNEEKNKCFGKE